MDADMDKVRRIMLEQQAVFQEQLQELHRVYRVQKALMLKPREQRTFELAVFPVKTEPNVSPGPAPPPRRRRTFDLERPAEEYMDVDGELDEPRITTANNTNSNSRDLAYQLNGTVSVPSLDSSALPRAVLESSGLLNGRVLGRSEKEAEFLHMLKRANSSDEAPETKRGVGGGGFGFMGALSSSWYGSVENGSTEKHNTPNGFHFGRGAVEDKGSKSHLQSELLPLHSKQSEASNQLLQNAVFLDSGFSSCFNPALNTGLNRLSSGSASCSVSSTGVDPAFNLNPFLSGGVSDENAKYNNRLQNHVSYSNQGILIPCSSASSTSGSVRRDPVLDGLWWKTFPNQSVVPPVVGSVPTSWPGGYIANHSAPSFHHSPILGMPGGFKDDNASGWLRGNNHTNNAGPGGGSTPGFHFSASTPPKPPFKKPPKLILDGNELRQVDGSRPAPGAVRHQPDSLVAEETAGVGERNPVDGGCFVDGGKLAEIPKPLETDLNLVPVSVSSDKSSSEKQSGVGGVVQLPEVAKSLEIQKAQEQGVVAEIVQETGLGAGLVESCLSEVNLGRSEDPLTCSCAQVGCRVCGKGSVEGGQMQTSWKQGVESSAPPREEVRENGEPPPPSGKKRKFKLLLATRESESGNRKKAEEGEISASRAAEPESSKPEQGGGEGERKKRKSSLVNSSSNNNNNSKRSSGHHHHEPSKESKMSPVSRHTKEKPHNGYSAMDNSDDGANLAAEILVSLAPRSAAPPPPVDKNSNSSSRAHHKSRRRSIDTLPTAGVTSNRPVSPSPKSSVEPKDGKKKKKKKSGKSKSPIDEDPPKLPASVKQAVKLGQTNPVSDYPESATERSSSKHKKKLVSKKQQLQQQQVQNHSSPIPRMSKPSSSGAGNPSKTTLNVVHSKTRDGVQQHHKSNNHHHHGNEKKRSHNNSSEHESVDHHQAVHHSGGNSSDDITEKGSEVEHEDSSWSRRSWGASARRKRMRRCKRSDL